MAFNFPDTPTVNQVFQFYTWDGEKWYSTVGGTGNVVATAPPLDGLTGVTGAWSASRKLLTSYTANSGAFYANISGDAQTWYDQTSGGWNFTAGTSARPTISTGGPNSRACLDFDGSVDHMDAYALSNFITSSNGYFIATFVTDRTSTNQPNIYDNDPIFCDNGGYVGTFIKAGSIYAFNWDGTADITPAQTISTATAYVVEWWHTGGNLNLRINGGTTQTIASGNTSNTGTILRIGKDYGSTSKFDGKLFELVAFNVVPASGVRDALVADMMTWVGAVAPSPVTYATWDPATVTSVTLSGGNLVATNTGTISTNQGAHVASAEGKTTGKYYFELAFTTFVSGSGSSVSVGMGNTSATYSGLGTAGGGVVYKSGNIWIFTNTGFTLGAMASGDVIGIAVDLTARKIWFKKVNGTPSGWNAAAPGAADPGTGVNGINITTGTFVPFCTFGGTGGVANDVITGNFGASAFVGAVPSGFTSGWPVNTPAADFLARTSGLDATHTNAYTALINGLVADGIWDKLDVLHIYATQDSTTALLNLVSTSYNGTANGPPTFTVDRGYTGVDASLSVYINTNFNPATASSPKFTQNSAHVSFWSVTNIVDAYAAMGTRANVSHHDTILYPRATGNLAWFLVNNDYGSNASNSNGAGHFIGSRSSSSSVIGYRNGATLYTGSETSLSVDNRTMYVLGYNYDGAANGSNYQSAMASIGSALNSTEATAFYNRLRTYMTAVGVP